jgi:hypothetical protein
MKLTRRKLAAVLLPVALPEIGAFAQTPSPAEDLLKTARDRMQANAKAVAGHPVPMSTEPAFQFKA